MISLIERSWPMASGVSVSGKATESRSGRIGSASGRLARTCAATASPSPEGMWMLTNRGLRSAPGARCFRPGQRDLDLEDAVLIGGARLARDHLGAELDDAAEGAVLDLDLLVEPPGGRGGTALAGNQELAAADLESTSPISTPASSP